jgi:hypothetical protein
MDQSEAIHVVEYSPFAEVSEKCKEEPGRTAQKVTYQM